MSLRPGSDRAMILYSSEDISAWTDILKSYYQCIVSIDTMKNKNKELISLDRYLWDDYPVSVRSREPMHITLPELSKVMKWKLMRGKARPLQALVDSNPPETVINASTRAFNHMESRNWVKAMECLSELKGIGVATASAILAPLWPMESPFMADEVIDCTCGKRDYNLKCYTILREKLISKAYKLNELASDGTWTAEAVGKALWIQAMIAAHGLTISTSAISDSLSETTQSKKTPNDSVTETRPRKRKRPSKA